MDILGAIGGLFDVSSIAEKGADIVDKFVQTDDEKSKAKLELKKVLGEFEKNKYKFLSKIEEYKNAKEKELTARALSDNEHSLTRLVRPASYIISIVFLFILMIIALLGKDLNKDVVQILDILKLIILAQTSFYFGGRTLEKIRKWK